MYRSRWLRAVLALARSPKDRRRLTTQSRKPVRLMLELLEDRITPSSFQTLYSFTGGSDGKNPWGGVILDGSGNLYGTTLYGGGGSGTLFEISSNGTFKSLYSFKIDSGGGDPEGTLIRDSSGNLYGTTTTGGTTNLPNGTVFEYGANGTYTPLHSFGYTIDGAGPNSALIMDNKGDLFGTTFIGSPNGGGAVFELSPDGSGGYKDTTLYSFSTAYEIYSGLVMDSAGNLYGTTSTGGASNSGVVFELSPDGSGGYTYSTLHTFTGSGSDGGNPNGGLVLDGKGNLYGTTSSGGAGGGGTVFKLSTDGSSFTTLYSFAVNGSGGAYPKDTLLMDPKGNLYGTTYDGGASNDGVVFELSPNGNGGYTNTTLHTFAGSDGANPYAGLTTDGNGNLYGTTANGGTNNDGTVFELTGAPLASTTTTAGNVSVPFSPNTQNVTLTANVTSSSGTVNEGTVTFTILQGSTVIGTATTSNTVNNGQASVSYALPTGLAAGTYTIDAVYNGGPDFTGSFDAAHALTVLLAPTVTTNPTNQTVTAGQSAAFTAAANGNPTPTVQWQVRTSGEATWTDISGATSLTLTLNNVSFSQNGNAYRAIFTNSVGSGTTTAATLTVQTPPAISSGNSATFTIGQGDSFTVTATGSPTPTLTESGALPSGVAFTNNGNGTASLTGTAAAGTQGTYHFTITAHNGVGNGFTQSFTLTVNAAPAPPPAPPSPPPTPLVLNVPPLLASFNSLFGGTETVNANGTETVVDSLFGIPVLVSTFDAQGNLVSVTLFGFTIPNWVWSV